MFWFHAPQMSEWDYSRHMFLVLASGAASALLGGHYVQMLPMWIAWWVFECIRDPR